MKYCLALLSVLMFFPCLATAQDHPTGGAQAFATGATPSTEGEPVKLEIENHGKIRVSETLIRRIFRETVREVAWQLNPEHPPRILAHVTLRLGAPGFTIETVEGKQRHTIVCMREWDEFAFARMVARAARNGLFTDQELDKHARAGLTRARAVTTVSELQQH